MIDAAPALVVLIGLCMDLTGAILMGLEAFGATEYLQNLDEEKKKGWMMTKTRFAAFVNQVFVYVLFSALSFLVLLTIFWHFYGQWLIVYSMLLCLVTYFVWQGSAKIAETAAKFTAKLSPGKNKRTNVLLQLVWALSWALLHFVVSIFAMLIRFGADLPLRFLSEKIVAPAIERGFNIINNAIKKNSNAHFKPYAVLGAVLLIFGFLFQIVGTLLVLIRK